DRGVGEVAPQGLVLVDIRAWQPVVGQVQVDAAVEESAQHEVVVGAAAPVGTHELKPELEALDVDVLHICPYGRLEQQPDRTVVPRVRARCPCSFDGEAEELGATNVTSSIV